MADSEPVPAPERAAPERAVPAPARAPGGWEDYLPPVVEAEGPRPRGGRRPPMVGRVPDDAHPRWPEISVRGERVPDAPDVQRMHLRNRESVRAELDRRGVAAALFYDPLNIRYVTGTRNMSVWILHNAARYCLLPARGPLTLFDFHNCEHLSRGCEAVDEVRQGIPWFFFEAGSSGPARARAWADEVVDILRERAGGSELRLAVDKLEPMGAHELQSRGVEIVEGQEIVETCRARKGPDELAAIRRAAQVCEAGVALLQASLAPGVSENRAWSKLHETNIANDGEWIETRLLSSGWRTNPWFRESSDREMEAGELVCLDTDLVGPHGMCIDISRAFLVPGAPADPRMVDLVDVAHEQIRHNMSMLRPGVSGSDLTRGGFPLAEKYLPNRYSCVLHGIGMADEWPCVGYAKDVDRLGEVDIVLEEGMTVCVESYVGEEGGPFGVKLEEQVLIGADGPVLLSSYPHDPALRPAPWA